MLLYKENYNENTKEIELMEWESDNEYDFSKDPISNIHGQNQKHNIYKEAILKDIEKRNRLVKEGLERIEQCKKCRMYYNITSAELEYIADETTPGEKLIKFKYCPHCRRFLEQNEAAPQTMKVIRENPNFLYLGEYHNVCTSP